jgi:negative regulator of sigma E activity
MSDSFDEQISEFIDDEMSVDQSEFFVRRLQRDDAARRQYLRYQLIGAAVRGEYRHPAAVDLGSRLEQALRRDATRARRPATRWLRWASGAGIAASVALIAIFGFRLATLVDDADGEFESPLLVKAPDQVTGFQYLIHHARYSSGMSRTILRSNVVAAQEADPVDASEVLQFD